MPGFGLPRSSNRGQINVSPSLSAYNSCALPPPPTGGPTLPCVHVARCDRSLVVMGYPITLHRGDQLLFASSKANTYWPLLQSSMIPLFLPRRPLAVKHSIKNSVDTDWTVTWILSRSRYSQSRIIQSWPLSRRFPGLAQATAIFRI